MELTELVSKQQRVLIGRGKGTKGPKRPRTERGNARHPLGPSFKSRISRYKNATITRLYVKLQSTLNLTAFLTKPC